jgi:PAS domain S-box-containing protein
LTDRSKKMSRSFLLRVWTLLTEPDSSIIRPDERRQAQFLAASVLALLATDIILIIPGQLSTRNSPFFQQPIFIIVLIATLVGLVIYGLSRSRYYKAAGVLTIVSISVTAYAIPVFGSNTYQLEVPLYLTISVLLSSILLSIRATALLVILNTTGCTFLTALTPIEPGRNASWTQMAFFAIVSIIILLFAYYRNVLERDQQRALKKTRLELEQRAAERMAEVEQLEVNLQREIADHQFAERVINETYAQLETRIAERTAALSAANELLQEQIAERSRAEAAERKQRILAEGLRDTAAAINSTLDLAEILDRILIYVERILPYDSASVFLIDEGTARVVHGRGFEERFLPVEKLLGLRFSITEYSNLRQMFEMGRPVIIPDTMNHPGWYVLTETQWIRSYVGAPIRVEGKVIGFLNLDSTAPDTFHESDAEKLLAFADQAGIAIRNAELFEAIRQHAANLETRVVERTAEVKREKAQLQAIMDSMNEGLVGRIQNEEENTYINAALLEMMGYSAEEWSLKRLKPSTLSEVEFDEQTETIEKEVSSKGIWQGEWRLRRKDNSEFDAYLTTSRIDNQDGQPMGSVTLIRDISQEKALQEVKSRFVANASHELRTPLTNLITRLYLLRKQPDKLEEHMVILDRVASRMRRLVDDLLDYSRFERGLIPLKADPIDVRKPVEDVILMQEGDALLKNIHLESYLPPDPVMIRGDADRINQVITNLVVNALYYTPDDGTIRVQVVVEDRENDRKTVLICVQDTGPGIPEDIITYIFLPFYRGSENNKGTGLGLAIAKDIIEGHNGEISMTKAGGWGSTFVIRLPLLTESH